jgi:hypothetical protein
MMMMMMTRRTAGPLLQLQLWTVICPNTMQSAPCDEVHGVKSSNCGSSRAAAAAAAAAAATSADSV